MNNLLSSDDRKHLPNKMCKQTCRCYEYWKKRLSEIEKDIVQTKERRTRLYKPLPNDWLSVVSVVDLKNLTKEHLIFLRLLKQEVLQIYREAKFKYLKKQEESNHLTEAKSPLWRRVHGKILHKITITNKIDNKLHTTYYVKLNEAHCSFSGFVENYNIQQTLEKEKDDLKNYSFAAFYSLDHIMKFYKSEDFKVEIKPSEDITDHSIVFDVVQYKAFKYVKGSLLDTHLTYDEFKKDFEYNSGESLKGMKGWFCDNFKNVLEKQFPGKNAFDVVNYGYFKKTFESWKRYYDMWQVNETPEKRRAKKCK